MPGVFCMLQQNIRLQTKLNNPSKEAQELPLYPLLPTDAEDLLRLRIYVLQRCLIDTDFRASILAMCRQDVAFFATMFIWLHETRDDAFTTKAGKFPFQPWKDQIDLFAWLQKYGGSTDMTIEKTRGIGLSWVVIIFLLWKWLFHGTHLDYGILSKDEKSLDLLNRPATLMGKLDLAFSCLPGWMQLGPDSKTILHRTLTQHRFENKQNGNSILGFTASDDKLRSARLNLIVIDEAAFLPVDAQRWLAASQFVSSSRIFVSTHDGTASFFYRMTIDIKSRLVRISTWWNDNPARAQGMYIIEKGRVKLLDANYKFPPDYPFSFDDPGLPRSPWVDGEFAKPGADHVSLMQEIYGTAALDTKRLFQKDVLDIADRSSRVPMMRCRINSSGEFTEDEYDGEWYFWHPLELPFDGVYYVGVDPAFGVADKALAGIVAIDAVTGETVVTAGLPETNVVEQAKGVATLCDLLCGPRGRGYATVVPESTGGVGVSFMTQLQRLNRPLIYTEGNKLGVHNKDRGEKILIEAGRAIRDGDLIINDIRIADDFGHFEYDSSMKLVFTGGVGHGDLGQATALGWWAARGRRKAILDAQEPPPTNKHLRPIEREIGYNKTSRNWSDRFLLKRY